MVLRLTIILIISVICVACARSQKNVAQGYIEGNFTYIATNVSGDLQKIMVDKGSVVKRGQILFSLDPQPEKDAYLSAKQNYDAAVAARNALQPELGYSEITFNRYQRLVSRSAMQQSELDNARSRFEASRSRLTEAEAKAASAKALLDQAEWMLQQKVVTAPVDGIIFDRYYRLGEYTETRQPVFSMLAPQDIKVIFFVNETLLGRIRLNDKVTVKCDNCLRDYVAHIRFISPTVEYTPPVIFSNDTNDKLMYRIEADFSVQDAIQLHPGQPVNVTYYPHDK